MKKRLLALALCLVMMTSLLPLTAAAAQIYNLTSVTITADGVEEVSGQYKLKNIQYELIDEKIGKISDPVLNSDKTGWMFTEYYSYAGEVGSPLKTPPEEGKPYYVKIGFIHSYNHFHGNSSFPATLDIPGYSADLLRDPEFVSFGMYLFFQITKNHEHTWQFTQKENTLTATCKNCDTPPVTLSLTANSVTLPDGSPFNAQLAGENPFKTAFPNAAISKIRYDYKGSDGVWHKGVDPVAANAKAGEYQAFVEISSLPGTVVDESGNILNQNGEASLYVKYTAVDPKVTAQTGDNRPIELMMAGVVVFSALAAAAFLLDNKRKYSR